jgi:hypothetical protein
VFNQIWNQYDGKPHDKLSRSIDALFNELNACFIFTDQLRLELVKANHSLSDTMINTITSKINNIMEKIKATINESILENCEDPESEIRRFEAILNKGFTKIKGEPELQRLAALKTILTDSDENGNLKDFYKFMELVVTPMMITAKSYVQQFALFDNYQFNVVGAPGAAPGVGVEEIDLNAITVNFEDPIKALNVVGNDLVYVPAVPGGAAAVVANVQTVWAVISAIKNGNNALKAVFVGNQAVLRYNKLLLRKALDDFHKTGKFTLPTFWVVLDETTYPQQQKLTHRFDQNITENDNVKIMKQLWPTVKADTVADYYNHCVQVFISDFDHIIHSFLSYPGLSDTTIKAIVQSSHDIVKANYGDAAHDVPGGDRTIILSLDQVSEELRANAAHLANIKIRKEETYVFPPPYPVKAYIPRYNDAMTPVEELELVPTSTAGAMRIDGTSVYIRSKGVEAESRASTTPSNECDYGWFDWLIYSLSRADKTDFCIPYKAVLMLQSYPRLSDFMRPAGFDKKLSTQQYNRNRLGTYSNIITQNIIARSSNTRNKDKVDLSSLNTTWIAGLVSVLPYLISTLSTAKDVISPNVTYVDTNVKTIVTDLIDFTVNLYSEVGNVAPYIGFMSDSVQVTASNVNKAHIFAELLSFLENKDVSDLDPVELIKMEWANMWFFNGIPNIAFPTYQNKDKFESIRSFASDKINTGLFESEFNTTIQMLGRNSWACLIAKTADYNIKFKNVYREFDDIIVRAINNMFECDTVIIQKYIDNVVRVLKTRNGISGGNAGNNTVELDETVNELSPELKESLARLLDGLYDSKNDGLLDVSQPSAYNNDDFGTITANGVTNRIAYAMVPQNLRVDMDKVTPVMMATVPRNGRGEFNSKYNFTPVSALEKYSTDVKIVTKIKESFDKINTRAITTLINQTPGMRRIIEDAERGFVRDITYFKKRLTGIDSEDAKLFYETIYGENPRDVFLPLPDGESPAITKYNTYVNNGYSVDPAGGWHRINGAFPTFINNKPNVIALERIVTYYILCAVAINLAYKEFITKLLGSYPNSALLTALNTLFDDAITFWNNKVELFETRLDYYGQGNDDWYISTYRGDTGRLIGSCMKVITCPVLNGTYGVGEIFTKTGGILSVFNTGGALVIPARWHDRAADPVARNNLIIDVLIGRGAAEFASKIYGNNPTHPVMFEKVHKVLTGVEDYTGTANNAAITAAIQDHVNAGALAAATTAIANALAVIRDPAAAVNAKVNARVAIIQTIAENFIAPGNAIFTIIHNEIHVGNNPTNIIYPANPRDLANIVMDKVGFIGDVEELILAVARGFASSVSNRAHYVDNAITLADRPYILRANALPADFYLYKYLYNPNLCVSGNKYGISNVEFVDSIAALKRKFVLDPKVTPSIIGNELEIITPGALKPTHTADVQARANIVAQKYPALGGAPKSAVTEKQKTIYGVLKSTVRPVPKTIHFDEDMFLYMPYTYVFDQYIFSPQRDIFNATWISEADLVSPALLEDVPAGAPISTAANVGKMINLTLPTHYYGSIVGLSGFGVAANYTTQLNPIYKFIEALLEKRIKEVFKPGTTLKYNNFGFDIGNVASLLGGFNIVNSFSQRFVNIANTISGNTTLEMLASAYNLDGTQGIDNSVADGKLLYSYLFKSNFAGGAGVIDNKRMFSMILNYFHKYNVSFNSMFNQICYPSILFGAAGLRISIERTHKILSTFRNYHNDLNNVPDGELNQRNKVFRFVELYMSSFVDNANNMALNYADDYRFQIKITGENRKENMPLHELIRSLAGNAGYPDYEANKVLYLANQYVTPSISNNFFIEFVKLITIGRNEEDRSFGNIQMLFPTQFASVMRHMDSLSSFVSVLFMLMKQTSYYNHEYNTEKSFFKLDNPEPYSTH